MISDRAFISSDFIMKIGKVDSLEFILCKFIIVLCTQKKIFFFTGKVDSANGDANNPIGSSKTLHDRRVASFRKSINQRGGSRDGLNQLTPSELVEYNPLLENHTPTTRLAYAKFKSFTLKGRYQKNIN